VADDLAATRKQAKKLFDELCESKDRAVLIVLTQVLVGLAEQRVMSVALLSAKHYKS
jgi:hypothetical protein